MMTLGYSTLGATSHSMGLGANSHSMGLGANSHSMGLGANSHSMGLGAIVHSMGLLGPLDSFSMMPLWQKVLLTGALGYGGYYLYKRHQSAQIKGFFSRNRGRGRGRRGLRGLGRGHRRFHW